MDSVLVMILYFSGGVALFLLGMRLLTDGLKVAAGESLRILLSRFTSTPFRGICSGVLITAVVQSSSAVIFATIGFVNAGLITLLQAAYVIFGSNVGTTLTGWIVATVGVGVNLPLLAMPMLAAGMVLWMVKGTGRGAALGQALVGFSLFFLGIDILKTTFEDAGSLVPFDRIGSDFTSMLLLFLAGILLTTVMQSSSAAIAVVITAAAGGLISVKASAVLVVGADIGTTSTALLAVIGATSNAKRAAVVHVLFNVLKVPVALPFISGYLVLAAFVTGPDASPAVTIALFHTFIKIAGLLVLVPFTGMIVRALEKRFTRYDLQPGRPKYIDDTIINTPSLAVSALIFELKRIGRKSRSISKKAIRRTSTAQMLQKDLDAVESLSIQTGEYIQKVQRGGFPEELEHVLPQALRVLQYFSEARELASEALQGKERFTAKDDEVYAGVKVLQDLVVAFLKNADSEKEGFSLSELRSLREQLESSYETVKSSLLKAGSTGKIPIREMVGLHDVIRNYRRMWDQYMKAAVYLDEFNNLIEHEPGTGVPFDEPGL